MKSKKELLDDLNNLVKSDICPLVPDIQKIWEDHEFQKKFAGIIGVKPKDINNGPKRNKSSYLFFCQEIRPSIVAEVPNIKPNQVMVCLGKKWSELPISDRSKYDELAVEDRKRYLASKEATKKLNKPIKISTYLKFCADERQSLKQQFPELSTKDITAKLGTMWNDYKKNNPQYLKTKYGYEPFVKEAESLQTSKLTPSIPSNISSTNVKAIQELIDSS